MLRGMFRNDNSIRPHICTTTAKRAAGQGYAANEPSVTLRSLPAVRSSTATFTRTAGVETSQLPATMQMAPRRFGGSMLRSRTV